MKDFLSLIVLLQIHLVNTKVLDVSEVLFSTSSPFKSPLALGFLFQIQLVKVLDGLEISEVLFFNSFQGPLPLGFLFKLVNLKQIF